MAVLFDGAQQSPPDLGDLDDLFQGDVELDPDAPQILTGERILRHDFPDDGMFYRGGRAFFQNGGRPCA